MPLVPKSVNLARKARRKLEGVRKLYGKLLLQFGDLGHPQIEQHFKPGGVGDRLGSKLTELTDYLDDVAKAKAKVPEAPTGPTFFVLTDCSTDRDIFRTADACLITVTPELRAKLLRMRAQLTRASAAVDDVYEITAWCGEASFVHDHGDEDQEDGEDDLDEAADEPAPSEDAPLHEVWSRERPARITAVEEAAIGPNVFFEEDTDADQVVVTKDGVRFVSNYTHTTAVVTSEELPWSFFEEPSSTSDVTENKKPDNDDDELDEHDNVPVTQAHHERAKEMLANETEHMTTLLDAALNVAQDFDNVKRTTWFRGVVAQWIANDEYWSKRAENQKSGVSADVPLALTPGAARLPLYDSDYDTTSDEPLEFTSKVDLLREWEATEIENEEEFDNNCQNGVPMYLYIDPYKDDIHNVRCIAWELTGDEARHTRQERADDI